MGERATPGACLGAAGTLTAPSPAPAPEAGQTGLWALQTATNKLRGPRLELLPLWVPPFCSVNGVPRLGTRMQTQQTCASWRSPQGRRQGNGSNNEAHR